MVAMTNGLRVTRLAEQEPDRPQVTCGPESCSRAEFDRASNRAARRLLALGATRGDYVSIALPNGIAFLVAAVAAWKIGAVPQPLSSRLPEVEREAILDLVRPAVLVDESFRVVDGIDDSPLPDVVPTAWKATTSGGSTGRPKVIVDGRPGTIEPEAPTAYRIPKQSTVVIPGPLYHTAPFNSALRAVLAGSHVVLMERFDAAGCLELIERHGARWVTFVPTMMKRILDLPDVVRLAHDLSSLDIVWHSGGPCAPWLKQAWIDWFGPERVWELYGATERQATTQLSGVEWLAHPGSVGRPNFGEIRIVDDDGNPLAAGQIGHLQLRSPAADRPTYRYLGAEPVTTDDGWDSAGDMGSIDADGYLTLADRRTDLIVRGGANVYPAEVEAALERHAAVAGSVVVGLPDDDLGERVHAILQLRAPVSKAELVDHITRHLARYKHPVQFEVVDSELRDEAGKVRRSALREERLTPGAWSDRLL